MDGGEPPQAGVRPTENPFPIDQLPSPWTLKSVWMILCRLAGKLSSSRLERDAVFFVALDKK